MSYSGDAAEQVVRIGLETGEVAVKLAGAGAKQIAVMLYAILRDQKKTRGKTRLESMLRSGKELKVFAVKDRDLRKFCQEAKKYGVLYCVLKDRDATDGITDIMVRAEDASKINRIFERFKLSSVDMASIRQEIEQSRAERAQDDTAKMETSNTPIEQIPENAKTDTQSDLSAFLDALFGPEQTQDQPLYANPTIAGTAYPSQSGHTSDQPKASTEPERKPSVKKQLELMKREQPQQNPPAANRTRTQHQPPKRKRKKKRIIVKGR